MSIQSEDLGRQLIEDESRHADVQIELANSRRDLDCLKQLLPASPMLAAMALLHPAGPRKSSFALIRTPTDTVTAHKDANAGNPFRPYESDQVLFSLAT